MNCNKCDAVMPDGSVYCGRCGARIDGKKPCPSCGKEIAEEFVFCNYCGARADGKSVCECGNVYEGNFCPVCGKAAKAEKPVRAKSAAGERKGLAEKIFGTVGGAAAAFGALISLIFVFLIGFTLQMPAFIGELGIPIENTNVNIYYYFGEYFQDMEGVESARIEWFRGLLATDIDVLGAFGIVVCALTLLLVAGFAIASLTLYVLGLLRLTKAGHEKWALAAMVSFVIGVASIYSLNRAAIAVSFETTEELASYFGDLNVNVATVWNGATKAAVIMLCIAAGIFLVCAVAKRGRDALNAGFIVKTVFSLLGVAAAIVVVCVGARVGQFLKTPEDYDGLTGSIGVGALQSNLLWTATFAETFDNTLEGYEEATKALMTMNILQIVLQLCVILTVSFAAVSAFSALKNVGEDKNALTITGFSLSFFLSIVTIVLSVLAHEQYSIALEFSGSDPADVKTAYTAQIVTAVFAGIGLAFGLLRWALKKRK